MWVSEIFFVRDKLGVVWKNVMVFLFRFLWVELSLEVIIYLFFRRGFEI